MCHMWCHLPCQQLEAAEVPMVGRQKARARSCTTKPSVLFTDLSRCFIKHRIPEPNKLHKMYHKREAQPLSVPT